MSQVVHVNPEGGLNPNPQKDFFVGADNETVGYTRILQSLHKSLTPQRYFEIGTLAGDTLALAECSSLAVDPKFRLTSDVIGIKPSCLMYQMTSDHFFSQYRPNEILGGSIDIAFLDGLHWFEYLLRDFINTEKACRRNSIILMHDVIPTDSHIARRSIHDVTLSSLSANPGWWAGDVWKTVAILLRYRPDLSVHGCRAIPTGLVIITNLDPTSSVLADNYFGILKEFRDLPSDKKMLEQYNNDLPIVASSELIAFERLASRFWL
jgi:hypothetical protein